MKRFLIVLGGDAPEGKFLRDAAAQCDYVLCADKGLEAAFAAGIHVDEALGDFDSASPETVAEMRRRGIPNIVYPSVKDDTDGMAATRIAVEKGAKEVWFLGACGGRIDHYVAGFQLLVFCEKHGVKAQIIEPDMEIFAVNGEKVVQGKTGELLSVIQMTENCVVSESGVFYPLDRYPMEWGVPLGVSNVLTKDSATITVHYGWALIVHYFHP